MATEGWSCVCAVLLGQRELSISMLQGLPSGVDSLIAASWALVSSVYGGSDDVTLSTVDGDGHVTSRVVHVAGSQSLAALVNVVAERLEREEGDPGHPEGYADQLLPAVLLKVHGAEVSQAPPGLILRPALTDGELVLEIAFRESEYGRAPVERLLGHLRQGIRLLLSNPGTLVRDASILTDEEAASLRARWQRADHFPRHHTLHGLFRGVAGRSPHAVAVVDGARELSYGEVDARSNVVARALLRAGVRRGDKVALRVDRCAELIIACLGILKAGAAYVPIDPHYPSSRVEYMLADADATHLVTQRSLNEASAGGEATLPALPVSFIEELLGLPPTEEVDELPELGAPEDLAYVIYTSGSTGTPKGVMVPHSNVVRLLSATTESFGFSERDVWTLFHSFSFDVSVWEVWGAFLAGGKLVIPSYWVTRSPDLYYELVATSGVTVLCSTPSAFRGFLSADERLNQRLPLQLRLIVFAGEALDFASLEPWFERHDAECPAIVNMYGITETTVHSTIRRVTADEARRPRGSLVGRAIPDSSVYLLDRYKRPVPVGVTGEIYVGGPGVAKGYWKRPELTQERFVPDLLRPSERMYKSGDLARYEEDGDIAYCGRIDHQVKIRGFRVELGEVESALRRDPRVAEAVVLAKQFDEEDRRLVAYVVPQSCDPAATAGASSETRRVSDWQEVFEHEYGAAAPVVDPTLNLAGWRSSFTGEPIPPADMADWVECTVQRLMSFEPKELLEIGCGTGMLLSRIAPSCRRYVATDLSPKAIDFVRREVTSKLGEAGHVDLRVAAADQLQPFADATFDTVVLNSVVQLFPSVDYLQRVLRECVRTCRDGGVVFLGDIRDLDLLEPFHAAVACHRAEPGATAGALRARADVAAQAENELLLSPRFFRAFAEAEARVTRFEVRLKRGVADTEMNRYRYDCVLFVGPPSEPLAEPSLLRWGAGIESEEAIVALLAEAATPAFAVLGIPDRRLRADFQLRDALRQAPAASTTETLSRQAREQSGEDAVALERLCVKAESLGYDACPMRWSALGQPVFDLVLQRRDGRNPRKAFPLPSVALGEGMGEVANRPLAAVEARQLASSLRRELSAALPVFMVPAAIVVIPALPLTVNGKVDKQALASVPVILSSAAKVVPPTTLTERKLVEIWREVLGIHELGVEDNYFELGGDSVLAIKLVSRAQQAGLSVSIRELFAAPTVRGLAATVTEAAAPAAPAPLEYSLQRSIAALLEREPRLEDAYPLTPMQEALLFYSLQQPSSDVYFVQMAFALDGAFDERRFRAAWRAVTLRHAALRSRVVWSGVPQPLQVVDRLDVDPVRVVDVEGAASRVAEAGAEALERALADDRRERFELSETVAFRVSLLRRDQQPWAFLLTFHHLLLDGWSVANVVQDFLVAYRDISDRRPRSLAYVDYVRWARGRDWSFAEAFWRQQLAERDEGLLFGSSTGAGELGGARAHASSIDSESTTQLRTLAKRHRVTMGSVVVALWSAALARVSGQRDVVFGVTNSGRAAELPGVEDVVGLCVNTVPVRVRLEATETLLGLVTRCHEDQTRIQPYEHVPLAQIHAWCSDGASDLFDSVMTFENEAIEYGAGSAGAAHHIRLLHVRHRTNYPLSLTVKDGAALRWELVYDVARVDAGTVELLSRSMEYGCRLLLATPEGSVAELLGASPEEAARLAPRFGVPSAPPRRTVHELFEEVAAQRPAALAVACGADTLTYGELNRRANQLARRLLAHGLPPEAAVGVCVDRSPEFVIAILAVLKAGGAYVPLDPAYPASRLDHMVRDARLRVIVTHPELVDRLAKFSVPLLLLNGGPTDVPAGDLGLPSRTDRLAYVMYTSGSTGTPKGAEICHSGIVRLVRETDYTDFGPHNVILSLAPVSFDASTYEIWGALLNGGSCVMLPGGVPSVADLVEAIRTSGANRAFLTAGLFHLLVDEAPDALASLDEVIAGGDVLSPAHVARLVARKSVQVVNGYGPTEVTTFAVTHRFDPDAPLPERVPIGRPIANTSAFILNDELGLAPPGAVGELYLGGPGLARSYRNDARLTAQRFLPDPFGSGGRLYRTGDLARYSPTSEIEFLGRRDQQVKVRGFRVELGEVEAALTTHAGVGAAAAAVIRSESGEKRLVAYYVPRDGVLSGGAESLREFLEARLPAHAVPTRYVALDRLPLGPTGKVDRRALPDPDKLAPQRRDHHARSRTSVEAQLAEIWQVVLGLDDVSVDDDFFALGGDSILSIKIVARAAEKGLKLTTREVFRYGTIRELAPHVGIKNQAVQPERPLGDVPLTPIQQWFFELPVARRDHWNQSVTLRVNAPIAASTLQVALTDVVRHHDAFRLRFEQRQDDVRQYYSDQAAEVAVWSVDTRESGVDEAQVVAQYRERAQRDLSLERGPLVRAVLFTLRDDSQKVFITIHHLVVDGVSWRILLEDLEVALRAACSGLPSVLRPCTTSFQRWSERLRAYAASPELARQSPLWSAEGRRSAGCPVRYEAEQNTEEALAVVSVELSRSESRAILRDVPRRARVQVDDCLLAALMLVLRDVTRDASQLITLEGHGREELFDDVDLSRTVGWFTTSYPVHLSLEGAEAAVDALQKVKAQLRQIPDKGIGYGALRYLVGSGNRLAELPRPWISFNYLGQLELGSPDGALLAIESFSAPGDHDPRTQREHLVDVVGVASNGRLRFDWYYSRALCDEPLVRRLADGFVDYLSVLSRECADVKRNSSYTSSDFGKVRLDEAALGNILEQVRSHGTAAIAKGKR